MMIFKKINFLFYSLLIVLLACKPKKDLHKTPTFLIGNWQRIHNDSTKQTYEFWTNDLKGLGFTLQNNDTVFKEILHFETQYDTTFLVVTGVNEKPTKFYITNQTDTSFVAENPTHDFPKIITYWIINNQLNAKVANDKFAIDFLFERVK